MELADKILEKIYKKAEELEFAYDDYYRAEIKDKEHLEFEEARKWLILKSVSNIKYFEYRLCKIALDCAALNPYDVRGFAFWSEIKEMAEYSQNLEELIDRCKEIGLAFNLQPSSWMFNQQSSSCFKELFKKSGIEEKKERERQEAGKERKIEVIYG